MTNTKFHFNLVFICSKEKYTNFWQKVSIFLLTNAWRDYYPFQISAPVAYLWPKTGAHWYFSNLGIFQ